MTISKNELLAEAKVVRAEVPGVGEACFLEINGERFDLVYQGKTDIDQRGMLARIVAAAVCNEDGELLFSQAELSAVNRMPLSRLKPLAEAAIKHSGLEPTDADELLGNSETITPNDSGTA